MEMKAFTCEFVIKCESVGQGLHEVFRLCCTVLVIF